MTDRYEFVSLCKELREMGATEVRAGEFAAVFATSAPALGVAVTKVQLGPPKPKAPSEPLEIFEGEQLSEADKERRRRYREIAGAQ